MPQHPCFDRILLSTILLTTLLPDGKWREYHLFTCQDCARPLHERIVARTPREK